MFSKEGLMEKGKEKWKFKRDDKKENQKRKQNRKKRRILKTGLSGEQDRKNPLKLQKNCRLGPFYKTHAQKHRKKKTKPPRKRKRKNRPKNTFLHFGRQPLIFGNLFPSYTLSCLQSCVFVKWRRRCDQ